jgi:hypothetical protein
MRPLPLTQSTSPARFAAAALLFTFTTLAACHHDQAVPTSDSNRPVPEDKAPPRPDPLTPPPPPVPGHTSR